jgi:predicted transcriptional regulator
MSDFGAPSSPLTRFQNTNAIFGITNIFEYLLEKTPEDAAEREKQQLVNIATAANDIPSLEHLVLHTLPAGEKLAGKGNFVPHMDVSENVASE